MTRLALPRPARHEAGALLLTVALLLAILAALAFSLNRGAGMGAHSVTADYERRNAAYLAQAAVAAAKWTNQVNKCGNASVGTFAFGGGSVGANVTKAPGGIAVVASATTAAGTPATLTRKVALVDLTANPENKNLGGATLDTTLTFGNILPANVGLVLTLSSGLSNALLYWPLTDIPKNSQVLSATLTMIQSATGDSRNVALQRVTTQWDASATWTRARPNVGWSGGDTSATPVAVASAGSSATVQWNVTGLVDSWMNGLLPNDGMLLRLLDPGKLATFYSLESGGNRPVLNVSFVKPC